MRIEKLTVERIIAELRRPLDFLKAFTYAQALIFTIYVFYGLYVLLSCLPGLNNHSRDTTDTSPHT